MSLFSSNANGKAFTFQAGLIATNVTLLAPTNGWNGLTAPVLLIVSNYVGDANGTTGQLHYISQSVLLGNSQATNANLTFFQLQDTNNVYLRKVSNYLHATSMAIDLSTDVSASITNSTSANVAVLLTNTVPGTSGQLLITSDGSARTFSVFSDKLITMLSTNETVNSTQIVTTASKEMVINWKVRKKTATSTNILVWAKSQP